MHFALIASLLLATASPSATRVIQQRDAEIRAVLPPTGTAPTAVQKEKAQKLLVKLIDFRGMVRASLGNRWAEVSRAERKSLLDAFTKRFEQAMESQLDFYRSTKIEYAPEQKDGDLVKVPTSMVVKGEPTHVTYAMKRTEGRWEIEDIVIDDVSSVQNYRSAFRKVIDKEGVKGLIARLEASTDEN